MRRNKKKEIVVAVSGGFDPLHVGHIEYFQEAKKLGDKLVVILNTDGFLMKKKGYVFMSFKERKKIIESIKYVDWVIGCVDNDETVADTLALLEPDIFAKGGDRNRYNIPQAEKNICEMFDIEIVDGCGEKVQSSSELVEKIRNL